MGAAGRGQHLFCGLVGPFLSFDHFPSTSGHIPLGQDEDRVSKFGLFLSAKFLHHCLKICLLFEQGWGRANNTKTSVSHLFTKLLLALGTRVVRQK